MTMTRGELLYLSFFLYSADINDRAEPIASMIGKSLTVEGLTELVSMCPNAIAQIANYLGIERSEVKRRAESKELILMPK